MYETAVNFTVKHRFQAGDRVMVAGWSAPKTVREVDVSVVDGEAMCDYWFDDGTLFSQGWVDRNGWPFEPARVIPEVFLNMYQRADAGWGVPQTSLAHAEAARMGGAVATVRVSGTLDNPEVEVVWRSGK